MDADGARVGGRCGRGRGRRRAGGDAEAVQRTDRMDSTGGGGAAHVDGGAVGEIRFSRRLGRSGRIGDSKRRASAIIGFLEAAFARRAGDDGGGHGRAGPIFGCRAGVGVDVAGRERAAMGGAANPAIPETGSDRAAGGRGFERIFEFVVGYRQSGKSAFEDVRGILAGKAAEEIEQAAAAANRINTRLAAFGTRQVSQQEVVSLNRVVRRAVSGIESVLAHGVELSVRADPRTSRVKIDAEQIEQALSSLVVHACSRMPEGGRLLIETGNAELPSHGRMIRHALLAITYTDHEPEPERLFEPSSTREEGLALSLVHATVTEHGGYISAQATAGGGCRIEMLLPAVIGQPLLPRPAGAVARSILLVEDRDPVRVQLHNFFEANGYNLLEAADEGEAAAIGQVHEGKLDVLVAGPGVDQIAEGLLRVHPGLQVIRVVDGDENGVHEIRQPFSQRALLERVEALLNPPEALAVDASA